MAGAAASEALPPSPVNRIAARRHSPSTPAKAPAIPGPPFCFGPFSICSTPLKTKGRTARSSRPPSHYDRVGGDSIKGRPSTLSSCPRFVLSGTDNGKRTLDPNVSKGIFFSKDRLEDPQWNPSSLSDPFPFPEAGRFLQPRGPLRLSEAHQHKVIRHQDGPFDQHSVGGQQCQLILLRHGGELVLQFQRLVQ